MFLVGSQMKYIVYDLSAWPRNSTNNFKFNCLFGANDIVKNSDKKSIYIVAME